MMRVPRPGRIALIRCMRIAIVEIEMFVERCGQAGDANPGDELAGSEHKGFDIVGELGGAVVVSEQKVKAACPSRRRDFGINRDMDEKGKIRQVRIDQIGIDGQLLAVLPGIIVPRRLSRGEFDGEGFRQSA